MVHLALLDFQPTEIFGRSTCSVPAPHRWPRQPEIAELEIKLCAHAAREPPRSVPAQSPCGCRVGHVPTCSRPGSVRPPVARLGAWMADLDSGQVPAATKRGPSAREHHQIAVGAGDTRRAGPELHGRHQRKSCLQASATARRRQTGAQLHRAPAARRLLLVSGNGLPPTRWRTCWVARRHRGWANIAA